MAEAFSEGSGCKTSSTLDQRAGIRLEMRSVLLCVQESKCALSGSISPLPRCALAASQCAFSVQVVASSTLARSGCTPCTGRDHPEDPLLGQRMSVMPL